MLAEVRQCTWGSAAGIEDWALDDDAKVEAPQAFEHDKHTVTAQSTGAALVDTWSQRLCKWHVAPMPIRPVEPKDIVALGTLMKSKRCCSFANDASWIQELRIKGGFDWSDQYVFEAAQGAVRDPGPGATTTVGALAGAERRQA